VLLRQQAADYYRDLLTRARYAAQREGVILTTELVEGDEVQAIMECVQRNQSDLLVLGLRRHSLLFSRLWNHNHLRSCAAAEQQHSGGSLKDGSRGISHSPKTRDCSVPRA
jgi:hypothetical protein